MQNQTDQDSIVVLDRRDQSRVEITDGDLIRLQVITKNIWNTTTRVQFDLDGQPMAWCSIPEGKTSCVSEPFYSLGWHWDDAGNATTERTLKAVVEGNPIASQSLLIRSRPVVMVHGFVSDWRAWQNYLGAEGFLAQAGISGFAVGDGQVAGRMNTGNLDSPSERTNTIHQNAEVLSQYIAQVKQATGAEVVDLLAHSMGGLISRYYIDHFMRERDVAQLIMLGSPMAGTECANLPAALGLYLPAMLEIRPSYVVEIFNRQVVRRQGIPFHALAGNPISDAFKSPCTSVPTDLVVSQASVAAIPLEFQVMPVLHTELNTSATVFSDFVLPLLSQAPDDYLERSDQSQLATSPDENPAQFSRVFTGRLGFGQSQEVVIQIEDGVSVASFALYDTSRSLQVQVRGASGNLIELSAEKNGLVRVDDPASLFYLGYGFQNPRQGEWRVTLMTTDETPPEGASYALSAYMVGGVFIEASATPLLPEVNTEVTLDVALRYKGQALPIDHAQAFLKTPTGESLTLNLAVNDTRAAIQWRPEVEGLYGIDLTATGIMPDGTAIERTAFLSVQAQPESPPTKLTLAGVALISTAIFVSVILIAVAGMIGLKGRKRS